MNGKIITTDETGHELTIHFFQPVSLKTFKLGAGVVVNLEKKIRSITQNNFYWLMLTWAVSPFGGRLCDQGRLSKDGLHCDIKAFMEAEHRHDFSRAFDEKGRFTTTQLTRFDFGLFFDFVNLEFMIEHCGLDMSPFWTDYDNFTTWRVSNNGEFDDYLRERRPEKTIKKKSVPF